MYKTDSITLRCGDNMEFIFNRSEINITECDLTEAVLRKRKNGGLHDVDTYRNIYDSKNHVRQNY